MRTTQVPTTTVEDDAVEDATTRRDADAAADAGDAEAGADDDEKGDE